MPAPALVRPRFRPPSDTFPASFKIAPAVLTVMVRFAPLIEVAPLIVRLLLPVKIGLPPLRVRPLLIVSGAPEVLLNVPLPEKTRFPLLSEPAF